MAGEDGTRRGTPSSHYYETADVQEYVRVSRKIAEVAAAAATTQLPDFDVLQAAVEVAKAADCWVEACHRLLDEDLEEQRYYMGSNEADAERHADRDAAEKALEDLKECTYTYQRALKAACVRVAAHP